jgi:hypothetical protein
LVDDLPQLLAKNAIWVRPFLSPPFFSAGVVRRTDCEASGR